MSTGANDMRTVLVEREFPFPPQKIWSALTQPHLMEEWLMKTDFAPVVGARFRFSAEWGGVDCEVKAIRQHETLSYTWAAHGLESVVTWTLTATPAGTLVRMEQVGFRPDQDQEYKGATFGWQRFFGNLETLLAKTP